MTSKLIYKNDGYKGWFIEWIEEWSQFFGYWNWRTFHPIMFEIEDDRTLGGIEATMILLGIGFRVRWNYTVTEEVEMLKQQLEEIKAEIEDVSKPKIRPTVVYKPDEDC